MSLAVEGQQELDVMDALTNNKTPLTPEQINAYFIQLYGEGGLGAAQGDKSSQLLVYALSGILTLVICCLGLVGNLLALVVLTRRSMRSPTHVYLAGLAISDALVCLFTAFLSLRDAFPKFGPQFYETYYKAFPYNHPLCVVFQVTSVWLTMAFTVDRYIMICHPYESSTFCSVKRAKRVIISLFIAGFIFNIPKFFEYKVYYDSLPFSQNPVAIVDLTTVGNSSTFRIVVHCVMYLSCVCGVPLLTLAVLNTCLIAAVRKSRRAHLSAQERRRNNTTLMLIGVVIIFIVCQVPAMVSRFIWAVSFVRGARSVQGNALNEVANFLVTLHSAVNFVAYFFVGKRFRQHFIVIFCGWRTKTTLRDLRLSERRHNMAVTSRARAAKEFAEQRVVKVAAPNGQNHSLRQYSNLVAQQESYPMKAINQRQRVGCHKEILANGLLATENSTYRNGVEKGEDESHTDTLLDKPCILQNGEENQHNSECK